jgi:alpha-N-acetylglucosaminidase
MKGKLLILDLMSELYPQFSSLDGYYGQPFIWCMLHNFGGSLGLYGAFNHLNSVNKLFYSFIEFLNLRIIQ